MTFVRISPRIVSVALSITSCLFAIAPAAAQWTTTGVFVPQLVAYDTAVQQMMTGHNIPSAQLAITYQGRLVLARGYSYNPGPNDIITQPDSLFRIASLSKPFTSILINRLIQEGRLSLTNTLGQYVSLTPRPGTTADPRLASVTIRNLLEHRAGFGNVPSSNQDPMFADETIAPQLGVGLPISMANIISYMNGVPLNSNPGTTENYSNYGYLLLGRVIESVTGMSYADYAASVLRPIGIWDMCLGKSELSGRAPREAYYSAAPWTHINVMNNSGAIVPYAYGGFNIQNMDAHGGWIMSAVEMVRLLSNLDSPSASSAILNQTSLNRMYGLPQNYPLPYVNGNAYYAQGWSVINFGSGKNVWHAGSLPGTSTMMIRSQYGYDYALFFNRRDESGATSYTLEMDNAMWNAYSQVTQWPTHDLFGSWLPTVFKAGFD